MVGLRPTLRCEDNATLGQFNVSHHGGFAVSHYRRYYVAGGTYFFTVVTYQRRPILTTDLARRCLREAIREVQAKWPWKVLAMVLLPDHLHSIWVLPPGDARYSARWQQIKQRFTVGFLSSGGSEGRVSSSRHRHGERGVWQRRFWEHTCRDEEELKQCVDYLHWNPIKHHLTERVVDYRWSTFHRLVRLGEYETAWGGVNPCPGFEMPE